jgi:3-hydroxyacyl-[acyl-carrier-protein] dehydratase
MRFHLIDRIEEVCYPKYITGVKCITLADDVFNEHFPGYPIFPGTLILEGMAQLGGSFFELIMKENKIPVRRSVLVIVREAKFKKPAVPGDKILYRAEVLDMQDDYGAVRVKASIDEESCAESELLFSFVDVTSENLQKSRQEMYDICMKNTRVIPG